MRERSKRGIAVSDRSDSVWNCDVMMRRVTSGCSVS